ncbi:Na+/H+ antiporter [Catenulispora rubra]|uniref:Na+/H+ antiporter n=1 Tax=Catenulispora rubra TaxID=280293 RepID=UPI001E3F68E9|nr:Na+/H+ antiporter [Catenulispora rubra]
MRSVEIVLALVVLATVVAALARRLSVPAPSLLVVAGVVVGSLPGVPDVRVTPEVVSLVVLPPLLYAAGEELAWRDLRSVWRPVTVLAVGLVLATAAAVGAVASVLTPLPASMAFVLGAILASTDPVAVTALGRRLALPAKIQALVQAESLFNDATSLVLFRVAVTLAVASGGIAWGHAAGQFLTLGGGGAAVGALAAFGAVLIRRRTVDPVMDTVIALVAPYATYVLAEALHVSGVTAVVVASVIVGTQTARITSAHTRLELHAVYATVVFLLESVIFSLIGLELPTLVRAAHGAAWLWQAATIAAVLIVMRALWVFPTSAATQRRAGAEHVSWWKPAVVSWAGARGVVPLAAALSVPLTAGSGAALPGRDLLLLLTTTVIVFTLVVQGFTLEPLVRRSRIAQPAADNRAEQNRARLAMARAALAELEDRSGTEPEVAVEQLRHAPCAPESSTKVRSPTVPGSRALPPPPSCAET